MRVQDVGGAGRRAEALFECSTVRYCQKVEGGRVFRVFKQGGWLGGKLGVALREEERWEDGKG